MARLYCFNVVNRQNSWQILNFFLTYIIGFIQSPRKMFLNCTFRISFVVFDLTAIWGQILCIFLIRPYRWVVFDDLGGRIIWITSSWVQIPTGTIVRMHWTWPRRGRWSYFFCCCSCSLGGSGHHMSVGITCLRIYI